MADLFIQYQILKKIHIDDYNHKGLTYELFSRCSWHFNCRVSNFNGSSRDLSYSDLVGVVILGDTIQCHFPFTSLCCFSTCPIRVVNIKRENQALEQLSAMWYSFSSSLFCIRFPIINFSTQLQLLNSDLPQITKNENEFSDSDIYIKGS